jgi:hypothetical protein
MAPSDAAFSGKPAALSQNLGRRLPVVDQIARQVAQRKFRQFAGQHLGSYGSEGDE